MTNVTAREPVGPNMVRLHQPLPHGNLIFGRLPIHVEHLPAGPDEALWLPMAVETPPHLERMDLPHERHEIDLAMAGRAADPFLHMDAVIEIDEIRQLVDSIPRNRHVGLEAHPDWLERRAVAPDLGMAGHAGLCGGHAGKPGGLYRGVAIPAVDAEPLDVVLMAEEYGLIKDDTHPRYIG